MANMFWPGTGRSLSEKHDLNWDRVAELVAAFRGAGASRMELRIGGSRLTLARPAAAPVTGPVTAPGTAPAPAQAAPVVTEAPVVRVTSPAIGHFRPCVETGAPVAAGDILGSVDSLAKSHPVTAAAGGSVFLRAGAGALVEYGVCIAEITGGAQ